MDLDTCKPEKRRQAEAADGRAETADTFDRAEFLRTKQEQTDGSTSLNVLLSLWFRWLLNQRISTKIHAGYCKIICVFTMYYKVMRCYI